MIPNGSFLVFNGSINFRLHIHEGLWGPWTATERDLVPFEAQSLVLLFGVHQLKLSLPHFESSL